jgi:hypothetical protein
MLSEPFAGMPGFMLEVGYIFNPPIMVLEIACAERELRQHMKYASAEYADHRKRSARQKGGYIKKNRN